MMYHLQAFLTETFSPSMLFNLSQVIMFVGLSLTLTAMQCKVRKRIIGIMIASLFFALIHYVLLFRFSAALLLFVAICRNIVCLHSPSRKWLAVFLVLIWSIVLSTFDGTSSILCGISFSFGTLAAFQTDARRLRHMAFIDSFFWVSNAIYVGSPAAVISESLNITSNALGYFRHYIHPAWQARREAKTEQPQETANLELAQLRQQPTSGAT